jgi:hypothetical protein
MGSNEEVASWEDLSASTEPGVGAKGTGGRQQGLPVSGLLPLFFKLHCVVRSVN